MNSSSEEAEIVANKSNGTCIESGFFTVPNFLAFYGFSNIIVLVLSLISAVVQVHVLFRAYIHIKGRTADKCLHVFLFSATFSDFILTAICYPLEMGQRAMLLPPLPYGINLTNQLVCWVSLIASSFSLVFMNLDKLAYFKFPLRYSQYFTRQRSLWITFICWLFATLYIFISWGNGVFICADDYCLTIGMNSKDIFVYIGSVLFSSVLPTLTSLFVAFYILQIMSVHQKQIKQEKLLCSPSHPHGRQNSVFLARMRTFYFVFMTTVFTALTLLPYRFFSIHRVLEDPEETRTCASITLSWILSYLVMLNSIANPILTCSILPQYRLGLKVCRRHYQMQPSFRDLDSGRESI